MSLCLVSAFFDIGRGGEEWGCFKRPFELYLSHFLPYRMLEHEMIVFIDQRYHGTIVEACKDHVNMKFIPIDEEWMKTNIWAYQQLEREREIMNRPTFKELIKHRQHHPECCKPEYNIMVHAKIDFVAHVIKHKLSNASYYAWSDFGYFKHPSRHPTKPLLKLEMFDLEKVNIQAVAEITEQDFDIAYTLTTAPDRIGAFFVLGSPDNLLKYQKLYHEVVEAFQELGVADDDQHIMLQCLRISPDLFRVWNLKGWHFVFNKFQ